MGRFYMLPNPEYLEEEELNFELSVRKIQFDSNTKIEEKKRSLRNAYVEDRKNPKFYPSNLHIDEEIKKLTSVVDSIFAKMKTKLDHAGIARIRHYLIRVASASVNDEKEERKKAVFCHAIETSLRELKQRVTFDPERAEDSTTDQEQAFQKLFSNQGQNTDTKLDPKPSTSKTVDVKQITPERLAAAFAALEAKEKKDKLKLEKSTKHTESGKSKSDKKGTKTKNDYTNLTFGEFMRKTRRADFYDSRRGDSISSDSSSLSEENSDLDERPGLNFEDSDTGSEKNSSPPGFLIRGRNNNFGSQRGQRAGDRYRGGRYEYKSKVEKWEISFSGDGKSMQVEDFLNRVKKLARHEHVTEQELLDKIHYKLRGDASDWWFTREHVCSSWEVFESEIRFRFANPNRDRGIKRQLRELQQKRGETFVAFVTEVEKLNQCLKHPHSQKTIFELIWENMRPHYRSKLATTRVKNLEHLLDLNHRIDANDAGLFRSAITSRGEVNKLYAQEDSDNSYSSQDEGVVNTIQRKPKGTRDTQNRNSRTAQPSDTSRVNQPTRSSHAEPSQAPRAVDSSSVECWNCLKAGHHWRTCHEPKKTFCYACGNLGRTTRTCERNHPPRMTLPTQNTNQQQSLN